VHVVLNYELYYIDYSKYHLPIFMIDVRPYNIVCESKNTIMFFIENPRTNIELVSGFFEFYFSTTPNTNTHGQVVSKSLITFRTSIRTIDSFDQGCYEYTPCILFTKGLCLEEMLIYLPPQELSFLKELRFFCKGFENGSCHLCCFDKKNIVNLHDNRFDHKCCMDCILKWGDTCPFCRASIV